MKTTLIFCFLILTLKLAVGQITIETTAGAFKEASPWNNGYLGFSYKAANQTTQLKPSILQYFNGEGEFLWKTEIASFTRDIHVVHGESSKYAYIVNSAFDKTAWFEKLPGGVFIKLFRVDVDGNLETHSFSFENEFECLDGKESKLRICYLNLHGDNLVIVTNDPQNKGEWYLFTVSSEYEVSKVKLDFGWNKKDWKDNKVSKLNFVTIADELAIIQVRSSGNQLIFDLSSYNVNELAKMRSGKTSYELNGDVLKYNGRNHTVLSNQSRNLESYFIETSDGYGPGIPKLGALFQYQCVKGELYAVACSYDSETSFKLSKPSGFCYFPISRDSSETAEANYLSFPISSRKDKVYECSFLITDKDHYAFLDYRKKKGCAGLINGNDYELPNKVNYRIGMMMMLKLEGVEKYVYGVDEFYELKSEYVLLKKRDYSNGSGYNTLEFLRFPKEF